MLFQEYEIQPSTKKGVKKKSLPPRHAHPPAPSQTPTDPSATVNSESPMVTTTTQVPSKTVPAVTSTPSTTETVNSLAPATSNSLPSVVNSTKTELDTFQTRSETAVQSSVLPPSQPTKVSCFMK